MLSSGFLLIIGYCTSQRVNIYEIAQWKTKKITATAAAVAAAV